MSPVIFRLGTRGSILALAQARLVEKRIKEALPHAQIETIVVKTTGDRITDRPLRDIGGKALFIKELEEALLENRIDFAVHSLKDVETPLNNSFNLPFFLPRQDPRDALISFKGETLRELSHGATVGTCSPRRKAQLLKQRPDLKIVPLRGNVDTRLQKVKRGDMDAICIAYAALVRLGKEKEISEILDPKTMLPAVAQGIVGIEIHKDRHDLKNFLESLTDETTTLELKLERHFLEGFGGDCTTPVAAMASSLGNNIFSFTGQVLTSEGQYSQCQTLQGSFKELFSQVYALGQEYKLWYMHHLISPCY